MALKSTATQKKQGFDLTPVISRALQNRPIRHTRFVSSYWSHEAEPLPRRTKSNHHWRQSPSRQKDVQPTKHRTKIQALCNTILRQAKLTQSSPKRDREHLKTAQNYAQQRQFLDARDNSILITKGVTKTRSWLIS